MTHCARAPWSMARALSRSTLAALAGAALVAAVPAAAQPGADPRPNVVVVMVDDMRADELGAMRRVNELLVSNGASFTRHYANHPLCCPSRVTLLTGQYAHNHGVFGNQRANTQQFMDREASGILPEWLKGAGYRTALVGKFLNEYGHARSDRRGKPFGFDDWHALIDPPGAANPTFYRYYLNDNGKTRRHGARRRDYLTTVLTDRAVRFIRRSKGDKPFFLWTSYFAPHNGRPQRDPHNAPADYCANAPKPAPGDLKGFRDRPLATPPSFDHAATDKPARVRALAGKPLTPKQIESIRRLRNCRLASLQAVDRGVHRIADALGSELSNTLIVFVSDNGFMLGEHRIAKGKSFLYEESSRVPLVLKGPGVPARGAVDDLVVNADIAPTILAVPTTRGVQPVSASRPLDGISLLDRLAGTAPQRRAIVLETNKFQGIHTGQYVWARYPSRRPSDDLEFYDLGTDPFQLQNIYDVSKHPNPADRSYRNVAKALRTLAAELATCAGPGCR